MKRPIAVAATLLGLVPVLVAQRAQGAPGAQGAPAASPRSFSDNVVHYGKWATAATAVGLTILAAHEHDRANTSWQRLVSLCQANNAACVLRSDGHYVDSQAETDYQQTLYYDHRARRRIIGAQLSVLASATLFILDLRHRSDNPPNIPFGGSRLELTAEPLGDGARVGVRMNF